MTKLLNLNDEELFEELYYNYQVEGVAKGIYFNSVDVTVFFDNTDMLEYAEEKGEKIDLDQLSSYYKSHEEEIDRHFFMEQIDEVREQLEDL